MIVWHCQSLLPLHDLRFGPIRRGGVWGAGVGAQAPVDGGAGGQGVGVAGLRGGGGVEQTLEVGAGGELEGVALGAGDSVPQEDGLGLDEDLVREG